MKILFLCGNEASHNYFVSKLLKNIEVDEYFVLKHHSGMSDMEYFKQVFGKPKMSDIEATYLNKFVKERNNKFKAYRNVFFENEAIVNSNQGFNLKLDELISDKKYDYFMIYGAPIIKNPVILKESQKSINFHFGLSRYYRGADTNIYALARGQFHRVGLTAHKLAKKVDSGRVLFEIQLEKLDWLKISNINELSCLLLKKGINKLIQILKANCIKYKNEEHDSEIILDRIQDIEDIIIAERNLTAYQGHLISITGG